MVGEMPPENDSAADLAAEAVSSVAAFLRRHHAGANQPRAFFAHALPKLLSRLFISRPPDWPCFLDLAAGDPALSYLLESLLAPSGPLLVAISAASNRRFEFPHDRLPDWLSFALTFLGPSDQVFSPLLAGRVGCSLHLSPFEYYLFWFAYYPNSAAAASRASASTWKPSVAPRARLDSWKPSDCSLYLKLLYAYLLEFVRNDVHAAVPSRRAEFVVHTLVQFWLVGNDFSPLPVQASRAYGLPLLSLVSRGKVNLSERLPAPGLGDAVKLLVMCLNRRNACKLSDERNVFHTVIAPDESFGSRTNCFWNPLLQRPFYRFVARTFLFCPTGVDIRNIAQVFSAWMVYLEPWKVHQDDFGEYYLAPPWMAYVEQCKVQQDDLDECHLPTCRDCRNVNCVTDGKTKRCDAAYSPAWHNFVLSNYLFYSSLVAHFLRFAHMLIHSDVALVLQMVSKVLEVLDSSELLGLIYKFDAAYHSGFPGSKSLYLKRLLKHVPIIREQLQDWEDGLPKHNTDGSFMHKATNSNLRLFSFDDDGAYNLLQLLLLRAESEIQPLPGDAIKTLDVIKSSMKKVFYKHVESSQEKNLLEGKHSKHQGRGDVFTPKHPSPGKTSLDGMKYTGDWTMRPISDNEVAWLARMLIRFSAWLNETLELKQADVVAAPTGPTIIKVDENEPNRVGGAKDAARMVVDGIFTLLVVVGQWILQFMRKHRIRINLRILASKKFLTASAMLYTVFIIAKYMMS